MVLRPDETRKLSTREEKEVAALEASIDEMLSDCGPRTFAVSLFPSGKVQDEITRKYEAAGWNVTYHSDWRDGDYLQFG